MNYINTVPGCMRNKPPCYFRLLYGRRVILYNTCFFSFNEENGKDSRLSEACVEHYFVHGNIYKKTYCLVPVLLYHIEGTRGGEHRLYSCYYCRRSLSALGLLKAHSI